MKFSIHILTHLDNKHIFYYYSSIYIYTTTLWPGTTSIVTTLVKESNFIIGIEMDTVDNSLNLIDVMLV